MPEMYCPMRAVADESSGRLGQCPIRAVPHQCMGNQSLGVGQMSPARRSQGSSTALLERLVLASSASPVMPSRADLEELAGLSRTVIAGLSRRWSSGAS
jgi:hypothetical protein